ncbi:hypothetical protein GDO81_017964 [Engystomops pustulosus]|uniref:Proteoglycan 4 n=1 Tax=Engystomops pustulosus TaxID=76066 RepID=A0AAV7A4D7_ENGPU|nr:hypothetical protein GDO81_017964 [Engystomops pustulosus]
MLHSSWLMAGGDTSNVARVPTLHLSEPNSDDKDKNPKKTIETLGDPEDPDTPPKEPNQRNPEDGDKPGKPKTPKGKEGDGPDGTGKPAKDPNQRNPDGGDEPGKPKTPKEKGEDGPEDTGKSPKEPNPKEKKKPKKTNTLEVEENIEEETDVNNANNEDSNKFKSNQRITKRRSPAKKNPKRLEDDSDDPSENPSPSDKKKKKPNSNSPDKKKGKPTDEDVDEDISPSDKGSNKPNSNKPNKKKAKPTKEDDDEPSKPGKGKKPKKKPNSKAISKIKKKKVNSEEERQETVESEFSSSSQSSSSHTRSKSTRRLTGKNKKKLKDQKKKFPELPPEDPLMPPDPKKDKELLPTPEPTFKDGGSGDDGSGMDFLSTTIQPTTLVIHSTTTASPTTTQKNQTEGTSNPSTSSTRNPGVTSERGRISTMTILPTTEATEKTTIMMSTSPQSTTAKDKTTGKSTSPETPPQQNPLKNLCIGQPADGMTTLQNGSMVVFRGPYFWMLHQGGVIGNPRKITEVWGIPSPIDTVFTRCNCGGKTFFFKGSRYWRFTNDVMDQGYPKEIIKGFGGLSGKITAVLPIAGFRTRPESVYFFKPGGYVQKYTFRQEQAKKCTKKKRPSIQYPIYSQKVQTVRYRFPRDIVRHRIQIHRTYTTVQQPLGVLHEQTLVSATWRGVPNNIISAISLPNHAKQDGFDYYTFTKDKYYNINMSSKVAVKPPPGAEQKTTKDWYKCKE